MTFDLASGATVGAGINVITMVSCGAGTGKTTLTAHLAGFMSARGRRCLVIDADPRGSFALYNSRRADGALPLASVEGGIERQLAAASVLGYEWVLIDTAPSASAMVEEAICAATMLIIPARPGFLDLAAVRQTAELVRGANKPYAVVLNSAPPKHDGHEALVVSETRAFLDRYSIPVWAGQLSECPDFAPTVGAADRRSLAEAEIAQLWSMLQRSVIAIAAAQAGMRREVQAA
jgi:chromosome partitioning protein